MTETGRPGPGQGQPGPRPCPLRRAAGPGPRSGGPPRNARPRDGLGRPLPKNAPGEPRVPHDLILPPGESLGLADAMLASGRPFHAHEVLEASWKSAPAGIVTSGRAWLSLRSA